MSKKTTFWNPDKLLSIAAIILSLGTLIVFMYQTNLIRKHQYASVMPYLDMGIENWGSPNIIFAVENNGVGPAIVEEVKIHFDNEIYEMSPVSFLNEKFPKTYDSIAGSFFYSAIYPGKLIPSEGRIELFSVKDSYDTSEKIYDIFNADNAQIQIVYKSIYDESWTVSDGHLSPLKLKK